MSLHPSLRSSLILGLCLTLPAWPVAAAAPQFPTSLEGLAPQPFAQAAALSKGVQIDTGERETVRLFFQTLYRASDNVAADWTGDIATCQAGTVSADYQTATIRRVNWYRAMAGLSASVVLDSEFSRKAQQAALMMSANRTLSHTPPTTWACYSADGAEAAGKSNLSLGHAGADAVMGQARDHGTSNFVVGHRRWILYPQTLRMGAGSVVPADADGQPANALWVFDDNFASPRPAVRDEFVAWPPPGYVPYQAVYPRWSFAYPDADFSQARVNLTHNRQAVAVTLEPYRTGAGENTLVWMPAPYADGDTWSAPSVDDTYQVTVNNVVVAGQARAFSYDVTVFDPATRGEDSVTQEIVGPATLRLGESASYTFNELPQADGYEWRQGTTTEYSTVNDAESGVGDFVADVSVGYSVLDSAQPLGGAASYHLAHVEPVDQILTLDQIILVDWATQLEFSSELGWATPTQIATVEVAEGDGNDWTGVWKQAGQNASAGPASRQTIALGDYAGKTLRIRFRYSYTGGTYYPQTTADAGWLLDDVRLIAAESLEADVPLATATQSSFDFSPSLIGRAVLQVRPRLFNEFTGEWSLIKAVDVAAGNPATGDLVLLESASPSVVGAGPGDDTYLLDPVRLTGRERITISDTQGTNRLQLVAGLSISQSLLAPSALRLTLSNGAQVTLLGADVFVYDAGGNASIGLNHPPVSFATFAQGALGVRVPASGTATGGAVTIVTEP